MSVAVVVKKGKCVAIGSDTLTRLGYTKEKAEYISNHSKILEVGENYIVPIGHASNQLVLESYFSNLKKPPILNNPSNIFEEARKLHAALKESYFLKLTEDEDDEYESLRMSCLIANRWGIFGLYEMRSVQSYTKFYAFGSGSEFALGAMRAVYDRLESVEEIARIGLEAAADFDNGCDFPIEVKIIEINE
jgi:ATP-dependent protease HslVU (ClpYQ) peptidase subunit